MKIWKDNSGRIRVKGPSSELQLLSLYVAEVSSKTIQKLAMRFDYHPTQPRDKNGRWSKVAGSGYEKAPEGHYRKKESGHSPLIDSLLNVLPEGLLRQTASALLSKSTEDLQKILDDAIGDSASDGWIHAIGEMHGRNNLPKRAKKLDPKDGLVLTRGHGNDDTIAQKNIKDFTSGEVRYGRGLYGQGIYAATQYVVALDYASRSQKNITGMLLPKSAKVIDSHAIREINKALYNKVNDHAPFEAYGLPYAREATQQKIIMGLVRDSGRLAAALGYDAIHIPREPKYRGKNTDYYILLNRSILTIKGE